MHNTAYQRMQHICGTQAYGINAVASFYAEWHAVHSRQEKQQASVLGMQRGPHALLNTMCRRTHQQTQGGANFA
jgi:hypothetical protein